MRWDTTPHNPHIHFYQDIHSFILLDSSSCEYPVWNNFRSVMSLSQSLSQSVRVCSRISWLFISSDVAIHYLLAMMYRVNSYRSHAYSNEYTITRGSRSRLVDGYRISLDGVRLEGHMISKRHCSRKRSESALKLFFKATLCLQATALFAPWIRPCIGSDRTDEFPDHREDMSGYSHRIFRHKTWGLMSRLLTNR